MDKLGKLLKAPISEDDLKKGLKHVNGFGKSKSEAEDVDIIIGGLKAAASGANVDEEDEDSHEGDGADEVQRKQ